MIKVIWIIGIFKSLRIYSFYQIELKIKILKIPTIFMILSIIVGFIAMIFLGGIPIIGPILAGFIAGLIAGGSAGRGAVAGFLSGIIGAVLFTILLGAIGTLFAGILGGLIGTIIGGGILILSLYYAFLGLVGGALGASLRSNKSKA